MSVPYARKAEVAVSRPAPRGTRIAQPKHGVIHRAQGPRPHPQDQVLAFAAGDRVRAVTMPAGVQQRDARPVAPTKRLAGVRRMVVMLGATTAFKPEVAAIKAAAEAKVKRDLRVIGMKAQRTVAVHRVVHDKAMMGVERAELREQARSERT